MFIRLTNSRGDELRVNAALITHFDSHSGPLGSTEIHLQGGAATSQGYLVVLEEPFVVQQKIENAQAGYADLFKSAR